MPGKIAPGIYSRGKDQFSRDKWLIRYELPRVDGKRMQKSEIFIGTKSQAIKRRREILYEIDHGSFAMPLEKELRVKEWLAKYEADHPVPSTHATARTLIKNHVIDELGELKLSKLTPYQIDQLYTKLRREKKLSTRTVRYIHSLLNQALKRAVNLNLISYNPVVKVEPPALRQREPKPFTDEQISQFLQAAKGNRLEYMFITMLGTGMRLGEAINLTWDQIDFTEKTITVINLLSKDEEAVAKTENSKRTIPMFPDVEKALKAQYAQQAAEKLKSGTPI